MPFWVCITFFSQFHVVTHSFTFHTINHDLVFLSFISHTHTHIRNISLASTKAMIAKKKKKKKRKNHQTTEEISYNKNKHYDRQRLYKRLIVWNLPWVNPTLLLLYQQNNQTKHLIVQYCHLIQVTLCVWMS